MLKKYIYILPVLLFIVLTITSCDTATDPGTTEKGSILLTSSPVGAQIWVDANNSGKTTPDSVTGLTAGNHNFTLKLNGYNDTTVTYNIVVNVKISKAVDLTSNLSIVTYSSIRMWETSGTTASQPSGLQLSTGTAMSTTTGTKDLVDLYYSSTGYVLKNPNPSVNNRTTSFFIGSSTNLSDNVPSPSNNISWLGQVADIQTNYFFVYDADFHYSKMKVVNWHPSGGPGDYGWVEVTWIYNKTVNDQRF